jgi:type I restriction enzyme S subunit
MNPELLLAHFNRVSDAPDAMPRLRRLILDLAVRGKLVDQHPGDEPASELLKTVHAERMRLVKEGQIKHRELSPIKKKSVPFSIPSGWQWGSFIEVAAIQSNLVNPSKYEGLPHIAPDNIESRTGRLLPYTTVGASAVFSAKHLFFAGCILYSKIRPALAKATIVDFDGLCSADMYPILSFISREYLHKYMLSEAFVQQSISEDNRVAMPKINQVSLSKILVPVPSLAEQHRIVAKVDELMALCDRLEAARAEQEIRRDRLTSASHHHLNNGADADALRKHSNFFIGHLPRLTARPDQIQQLRQTILNLAVCGKIVPQDPNDEPAPELLKRIQEEIARLVSTGEAKEKRSLQVNRGSAEPFDIPRTWLWASLGQVAFGFRYGTSMKCTYERTGEPVLRIPNIDNGRINIEDLKFGPLHRREADDLRLQLGDILMVRSNGSLNLVGRPALVEANAVGYCYAGYLVRVRTSPIHLDARYLLLALNSAHVRDQIELPIRTTVGLKNVNATELSSLTIPLPPLAEQHRIVVKVDELMALCDRLEAQLTSTQIDTSRLLEAVLNHALNSGDSIASQRLEDSRCSVGVQPQ